MHALHAVAPGVAGGALMLQRAADSESVGDKVFATSKAEKHQVVGTTGGMHKEGQHAQVGLNRARERAGSKKSLGWASHARY